MNIARRTFLRLCSLFGAAVAAGRVPAAPLVCVDCGREIPAGVNRGGDVLCVLCDAKCPHGTCSIDGEFLDIRESDCEWLGGKWRP